MKRLCLLLTVFCFGCASLHPGEEVTGLTPEASVLKVSISPSAEYSDPTNVFLDFTLENLGSEWVRIEKTELEFDTETKTGSKFRQEILVGDDLRAWAESYATKKRIDDHNAEIGIAGLVLAGMTAIVASGGNMNVASAGAVTAAGGLTAGSYREYSTKIRNAESSRLVPESCLLAPITIPSQGAIKRWVVVHTPDRLIGKKAKLTLRTKSGRVMTYEVPVKLKWVQPVS